MSDAARPFTCLVVEDDEELRELIGFLLESKFHATVKYAVSGNQAIAILQKDHETIDLIVSDNRMPDGDGSDLYKAMHQAKINTPFILCSSDTPEMHPEFSLRPLLAFVPKPVIQGPLVEVIRTFLNSRKSPGQETNTPSLGEFIRVHIRLLRLAERLEGEAFIRVSENKFVRAYKKDDPFTDEEFEKNSIKNIEFLYIRQSAINSFLDRMVEKYSKAQPQVSVAINQYLEATIQDIGARLGFTEELERMTKESIQRSIRVIEKNPSLAESLKLVSIGNRGYVSTHSTILSCVSCWVAGKMGWQSEEILTKLIMASLLHDVTFSDEELAKVQDENELLGDDFEFTAEGIKSWHEHPARAAAIASRFKEIPKDVDALILQHHERPHGGGMPNSIDHTRISSLSALFIISHELTNYILANQALDIKNILKKFVVEKSATYDVGHFKAVMVKLQ